MRSRSKTPRSPKRQQTRKRSGRKLRAFLAFLGLCVLGVAWWDQSGRPIPSFPWLKPERTPSAPPAVVKRKEPPPTAKPEAEEPISEPEPRSPVAEDPRSAPPAIESSSPSAPSAPPAVPDPEIEFRRILDAQIALARQGISPGPIDGILGSQTRAALRVFQQREGLPQTGVLDTLTGARLALLTRPDKLYIVSSNDLARLTPIGQTWLAKSAQDRLDYESILEMLAEQSFSHPNLLRKLNPGLDWNAIKPGTSVVLPAAEHPQVRAKAAFIRISLSQRVLQAFDVHTNLLVHFPCSIAARVEKRPVGLLFVETVVEAPNYRFHPDIFPESPEARQLGRPLMIPPGPNNPVGSAWIGLSRPSYGIHGTPYPEEVGRTESHGCFRLANWNARYLTQLVRVGTPVLVEL